MKTLYFHTRKMPMFSLANVLLIMIIMVLMTGCAGAYNAPPAVVNTTSVFNTLPYEQVRQGVILVMRQQEPLAKAFNNPVLRQWAYTWPGDEEGVQFYAYARSTGELLKGGGTIIRGSPALYGQFVANLTSKIGGYIPWIGPAIGAAMSKNPDMLITLFMSPMFVNNSAPPDTWDLRNYMSEDMYCKYFATQGECVVQQ